MPHFEADIGGFGGRQRPVGRPDRRFSLAGGGCGRGERALQFSLIRPLERQIRSGRPRPGRLVWAMKAAADPDSRPRARARRWFRSRSRRSDRPTIRAQPRARCGRPASWSCNAGRWDDLGDCSWALSTTTKSEALDVNQPLVKGRTPAPIASSVGRPHSPAIFGLEINKCGNCPPPATRGRVRARTRNRLWRGPDCRKYQGDRPD